MGLSGFIKQNSRILEFGSFLLKNNCFPDMVPYFSIKKTHHVHASCVAGGWGWGCARGCVGNGWTAATFLSELTIHLCHKNQLRDTVLFKVYRWVRPLAAGSNFRVELIKVLPQFSKGRDGHYFVMDKCQVRPLNLAVSNSCRLQHKQLLSTVTQTIHHFSSI